jgi:hypothetical protein
VLLHRVPLLGGERPVLVEDAIRDPQLADVVQQPARYSRRCAATGIPRATAMRTA